MKFQRSGVTGFRPNSEPLNGRNRVSRAAPGPPPGGPGVNGPIPTQSAGHSVTRGARPAGTVPQLSLRLAPGPAARGGPGALAQPPAAPPRAAPSGRDDGSTVGPRCSPRAAAAGGGGAVALSQCGPQWHGHGPGVSGAGFPISSGPAGPVRSRLAAGRDSGGESRSPAPSRCRILQP